MDTTTPEAALLQAALEHLKGYGLAARLHGRQRVGRLPNAHADAIVRLGYGGREQTWMVEVRRHLRPQGMGALIHQMERLGEHALLVADHVTPPLADALRAQGIQFVDAAGNAWIDWPPLRVWVKGEKPADAIHRTEPTGRAFQAGGLQVLLALLSHPEWATLPYRVIAGHAGVAHGTVGWVMADLPKLGYLAELDGERTLLQRDRLLRQWAEFYPRVLRPRLLIGRYRADAVDTWATLDPTPYGAVLGSEPAGARLTGHLRPATATFYTTKLDPRLLLDLKLRADPNGNVTVYRRFWTFDAADPALAPDPLVYADLLATGDGRCIETARMIHDRLVGRNG